MDTTVRNNRALVLYSSNDGLFHKFSNRADQAISEHAVIHLLDLLADDAEGLVVVEIVNDKGDVVDTYSLKRTFTTKGTKPRWFRLRNDKYVRCNIVFVAAGILASSFISGHFIRLHIVPSRFFLDSGMRFVTTATPVDKLREKQVLVITSRRLRLGRK